MLPSLVYSQITLKSKHISTDSIDVAKRASIAVARADSLYAIKYANLPPVLFADSSRASHIADSLKGFNKSRDTTIYIVSAQSGITNNVLKTGKIITFLHSFVDTGYVVKARGYKGAFENSLSLKRWADSIAFYPVDDSVTVEWEVQSPSAIAGTILTRLAGTVVNFLYPFSSTNYFVSVLGLKSGNEVTVGVLKSSSSIKLYPATDSTQVMWSTGSITQ